LFSSLSPLGVGRFSAGSFFASFTALLPDVNTPTAHNLKGRVLQVGGRLPSCMVLQIHLRGRLFAIERRCFGRRFSVEFIGSVDRVGRVFSNTYFSFGVGIAGGL